MQVQGKLHVKMDTQQVSERFRKREFVIEYVDNPLYPQFVLFQLTQDRCELLESYEVGTMLDVEFNLRGRSWTSPQGEVKYFNSLEAWRLSPVQVQQPAATPGDTPLPTPPPDAMDVTQMEDDDDLPF